MVPVRVALVEDDAAYASSLEIMLRHTPGLAWIATCDTVATALRDLPPLHPRIVLVDLGLPDGDGIECIQGLREACPTARPIVLSKFDDDTRIFAAIRAGAFGYVYKADGPRAILDGIEAVAAGQGTMSPSIARRALELLRGQPAPEPPNPADLDERAHRILALVKKGLLNKEIGDQLGLKPQTVANILTRIYAALHISGRHEIPP